MRVNVRKQTRNDFDSRIKRLDPKFAATPVSERFERKPWELQKLGSKSERPFLMVLLGIALAMTALWAIEFPEQVQSLLLQSGWPAQFLAYAMNGVSLLILAGGILLLMSMVRVVNPRATGRWNAAGITMGAIAGLGLYNTPDAYIDAGLNYAGFETPADVIDYAQDRKLELASIDWASLVMVSSAAK